VGCSFGFGLWARILEASYYGRPSREAVGVHGQRFKLWAWPLEALHCDRLKAPNYYIILAMYLQPISLDSQQKFRHSIPRPLDFDGHSVKRPKTLAHTSTLSSGRKQAGIRIRSKKLLGGKVIIRSPAPAL
jgi:hypothetical protein